ncbi:hypothetical protein JL722_9693 [Aureococcus anophagefferens]|nr:hypothetical protein JL722_9693 [Aureococcus anophagefferens]
MIKLEASELADLGAGESALAQAAAVDAKVKAGGDLGALEGLPVVIKVNIDVAGTLSTASTPGLAEWRPATSAPCVEKLLAAGAIPIAKTNMPEMAVGFTGQSPVHGTCLNPRNTAYNCGGSSSGTAAAVAAGVAACGLGSDTGGSLRGPAALCGVVGFRPSRWPGTGVVPISALRDTPGPMGATVADVALLDAVVNGEAPVAAPDGLAGVAFGAYLDGHANCPLKTVADVQAEMASDFIRATYDPVEGDDLPAKFAARDEGVAKLDGAYRAFFEARGIRALILPTFVGPRPPVALSLRLVVPLVFAGDAALGAALFAGPDESWELLREPLWALSWVITWFAHDVEDGGALLDLWDRLLAGSALEPCYPLYVAAALVLERRGELLDAAAAADHAAPLHAALARLSRTPADWRAVAGASALLKATPPPDAIKRVPRGELRAALAPLEHHHRRHRRRRRGGGRDGAVVAREPARRNGARARSLAAGVLLAGAAATALLGDGGAESFSLWARELVLRLGS